VGTNTDGFLFGDFEDYDDDEDNNGGIKSELKNKKMEEIERGKEEELVKKKLELKKSFDKDYDNKSDGTVDDESHMNYLKVLLMYC
jgi:hypothetical protein